MGVKLKSLVVHKNQLARFDIFGVVDSAAFDIAGLTLIQYDFLAIRHQLARFFDKKLDRKSVV